MMTTFLGTNVNTFSLQTDSEEDSPYETLTAATLSAHFIMCADWA